MKFIRTNNLATFTGSSLFIIAAFLFGLINTSQASDTQSIIVINNLPNSDYCPNGNTLSVFVPSKPQELIDTGSSKTFTGDFSSLPGMGIQINNWYWTADKRPVAKGSTNTVQNPDNSGAQFAISNTCTITQNSPPWFGKGIPTYLIANVTTRNNNGQCEVTVSSNNFTDAVTPGCCSPPGIGSDTCKSSQWGKTANDTHWPPSP